MGGLSALGTAANSYLFLLRVRAVYGNARSITIVFGAWWVALVGTTLTFPFPVHASVSKLHSLSKRHLVSFLPNENTLDQPNDATLALLNHGQLSLCGQMWRTILPSSLRYPLGSSRILLPRVYQSIASCHSFGGIAYLVFAGIFFIKDNCFIC